MARRFPIGLLAALCVVAFTAQADPEPQPRYSLSMQGEALYQRAHKMKGAVSNFPGDPSLDLSQMLETAAREGDFARASTLLYRLEPAVRALERRISAVARNGTTVASA